MNPNGEHPDEVPEADALEQERGVVDDDAVDPNPDSLEVPDADAYEQRQAVGGDDEDDRR